MLEVIQQANKRWCPSGRISDRTDLLLPFRAGSVRENAFISVSMLVAVYPDTLSENSKQNEYN